MTFCNVIRMVIFWPKRAFYVRDLSFVLFRQKKVNVLLLDMNV